ncbi:serine hydrolase family protein [Candidatus Woesearchaeota archaeon]|nr:serine hydrolase family protein [Candidatus Woesearchaeota archaeon]
MSTIFLFHGAYGSPRCNWFPWLKNELQKLGHKVIAPQFPTPEGHNLKNWLQVFSDYSKYVDQDSIFVVHSIGCAFALNVIQRSNVKIKAAFLVAGFVENLRKEMYDSINHSFYEQGFNWQKIKSNCSKFYLYASDNDPAVPLQITQNLADKLGVKIKAVKGAGHFSAKEGYKVFPLLLEDMASEQNN